MQMEVDKYVKIEAGCPYYGVCGGCSLQDIAMRDQIEFKQERMIRLLEENGGIVPEEVLPPIEGPHWNYRGRARLAVKDVPKKGGVLVGFRERHKKYVTDMSGCRILIERVSDLIIPLRDMITNVSIANRIPQIEVAVGDDCTALTIRHLVEFSEGDILSLKCFEDRHGVSLFLQPGGPDTVRPIDQGSARDLVYRLPGWDLTLEFGPLDFIQVNKEINRLMIDKAVELMEPAPGECIADLFCGLGNFSLPLASMGSNIIGYEGSEDLVDRARINAERNGLNSSASFLQKDLYNMQAGDNFLADFDKVLLDPPRSGAKELVESIRSDRISRIVYVSCNPETLARDAQILVDVKGYALKKCGMVNMFPHTMHAEAIALFQR